MNCDTCGGLIPDRNTGRRSRFCSKRCQRTTTNRKSRFGISVREYDELLSRQGFACAICKRPCSSGRALAVDHDHKTGRVRGLLCGKCNRGIGLFGDKPARLSAAILYLTPADEHGVKRLPDVGR